MGKNKKKNRRRGRPRPHYRGKPLWQILDNLPHHGVGRLIVRGSFKQNEEEPSYMRILEVDMSSKAVHKGDKGKIKVPVKVERIWRGVIFPRPVNITSTSYLADFQLVSRNEEEKYVRNTKTASEKGYYYWTEGQKKRIKNRIEEGMAPYEAKQRELEMIAKEQSEAAQRDGVKPSQAPIPKLSETNYSDNFEDDVDAEATDDSFASDYAPQKNEPKNKKAAEKRTSVYTQNEFQNQQNTDVDFKNFSKQQRDRVEKMIQNGMDPDTAKQMEWERQVAMEAVTGNNINEVVAGPSRGLKRSLPQPLNSKGIASKLSKIG